MGAGPVPAVAGTAGVTASGFAALRTAVAADGDVAAFTVVGRRYADPKLLRPGVPVIPGTGYDGQFYYRLALDPADLSRWAQGIRLDSADRLGRIAYPALAWLLAAGRWWLVPYSLVAVNVLCVAALAAMGAVLARRAGLSCWWGLALAGFAGFLWTEGRDLTELVAAAALVAGLLAARRRRPLLAGVALAVAVLARETELIAVGCIVVADAAVVLRCRRRWPRLADLLARAGLGTRAVGWPAWTVPLVAFVTWQAVVAAVTSHVPVASSGAANIGVPLAGVLRGAAHYLALLPRPSAWLWFAELAVLLAVAVSAAPACRPEPATGPERAAGPPAGRAPAGEPDPAGARTGLADRAGVPAGVPDAVGAPTGVLGHERLLWVAALALMVCLAPGIWLGDVGFRSLDDVFVVSWFVLLVRGRRPVPLAGVVAVTWLVVFAELVRFV